MPEFRTAAGLVSVTPFVRTAGGLVECSAMFRGSGGLVESGGADPLSASAEPSYVARSGRDDTPTLLTTSSVTVTVAGGRPPYSFSWSDDVQISATDPQKATTAFQATVSPNDQVSATLTCTVTDAKGTTATANVDVTITNFSTGGGLSGPIP